MVIIDQKYDDNSENSFIDCKDLRHPMIERLQNNDEYIPNDVLLNQENNGILLFGTNALEKVV